MPARRRRATSGLASASKAPSSRQVPFRRSASCLRKAPAARDGARKRGVATGGERAAAVGRGRPGRGRMRRALTAL